MSVVDHPNGQVPAVDCANAEVTVIIISFNTRDMTIKAIETLLANTDGVSLRIIVWDNASHDGSASAVAERFPDIEVIAHDENLGFPLANNLVAQRADSEWLLLLNSDTETHLGAVEKLLDFARQHPEAGIVGGRTLFGDGTLNATSCFNRSTLWSLFCQATGLARVFSGSVLFNSEGIGGWRRDTVREVDVVTGCLLLIRTELWNRLGGFNDAYFMYGDDVDLCLRARKLGYRPMMTPDATIVHHGGASAVTRGEKLIQLLRARATIVRDFWSKTSIPLGLAMLWLWIAIRHSAAQIKKALGKDSGEAEQLAKVWRARHEWLKGYPPRNRS